MITLVSSLSLPREVREAERTILLESHSKDEQHPSTSQLIHVFYLVGLPLQYSSSRFLGGRFSIIFFPKGLEKNLDQIREIKKT